MQIMCLKNMTYSMCTTCMYRLSKNKLVIIRSKENLFVLQLERFNAKMAEMDKTFKHELLLIKNQHSKLTVCSVKLQLL